MPNAAITTREFKGDNRSVKMSGAVPDGKELLDGVATSGSTTFTSATAGFTSDDVGKIFWLEGGAGASSDLLTTIVARISATSIRMGDAATHTVSAARFRYGTDNTVAIQKAFDWAAPRGIRVAFPRGMYLTTDTLKIYSNLILAGQGYTHGPFVVVRTAAQLVCCAPVDTIFDNGANIQSFVVEGLTIRGTARTGSRGIHLTNIFGVHFRDLSLEFFGDQGMLIENGGDGSFSNVWVEDCLKVRTGRAAYTGALDLAAYDLMMNCVRSTTSATFDTGAIVGGKIGDGFGAGICLRLGQTHAVNCFGHGSALGWYLGPSCSRAEFVNCRADYNQGHGWVIDGFNNALIGCRSYANSVDTDATYHGMLINGAGNKIHAPIFTWNGAIVPGDPAFNRVLDAIHITTAAAFEANQIELPYFNVGCYTGVDVNQAGTQKEQAVIETTSLDFNGRKTLRVRADLTVKDGIAFMYNSAGGSNQKIWSQRFNASPFQFQLLSGIWDDAFTTEVLWQVVQRTGNAINYVAFPERVVVKGSADDGVHGLQVLAGGVLLTNNGDQIVFGPTGSLLTNGVGSPEGVVTAPGGSIYMDGSGPTWLKASGVGNTGWVKIGSGSVSSVALSMPAIFSVSGSPVTTSGTLAVTLATETANLVFAGPTSGGAATPTFRALVNGDLPVSAGAGGGQTLTLAKITGGGANGFIQFDTHGIVVGYTAPT